ncbi:MAG: ATPase, T2SS/T4P/T4SS family [Methanopyri archaeon]|nr:ATPase, T2SS/T4P/T4SS family [Methanopyri archaeon]
MSPDKKEKKKAPPPPPPPRLPTGAKGAPLTRIERMPDAISTKKPSKRVSIPTAPKKKAPPKKKEEPPSPKGVTPSPKPPPPKEAPPPAPKSPPPKEAPPPAPKPAPPKKEKPSKKEEAPPPKAKAGKKKDKEKGPPPSPLPENTPHIKIADTSALMASKIAINYNSCTRCAKCVSVCPKQAIKFDNAPIMCKHCTPETADCAKACPEKAIVPVGAGKDILSVQEDRCTGCGECVKACPYDSIWVLGDIARKCDICYGVADHPLCLEECANQGFNAIEGVHAEQVSAAVDTGTWSLSVYPAQSIQELEPIVINDEGTARTFGSIAKVPSEPKPVYYVNVIPSISDVERTIIKRSIDRFIESGSLNASTYDQMKAFILEVARYMGAGIDPEKLDPLSMLATLNSTGFGPFDLLLKDDALEEVMGIGVGQGRPIYVYHRKYGMLKTNVFFNPDKSGQNEVRAIIERMVRSQPGAKIDDMHPRVNTRLPDGSRLHACISPMTLTGSLITIRKFRANPLTPIEIAEFGTMSIDALTYMWLTLENEISMLIGGNTGSGKTTTLNAISTFIPPDERIIILESTPEINLPHGHQARVVTVPQAEIGMEDLLEDTLRMRPDRVIVGEVRSGEEARAFINSVLAGQARGCMCTFHALDATSAAKRMKNPPMNIAPMDIQTLDIILVQRRLSFYDSKERKRVQLRRVIEIVEIDKSKPAELDIPPLMQVYKYDTKSKQVVRMVKGLSPLERRIAEYNMDMTDQEYERERYVRMKFLESLYYRHKQQPGSLSLPVFMDYITRFSQDKDFRTKFEASVR